MYTGRGFWSRLLSHAPQQALNRRPPLLQSSSIIFVENPGFCPVTSRNQPAVFTSLSRACQHDLENKGLWQTIPERRKEFLRVAQLMVTTCSESGPKRLWPISIAFRRTDAFKSSGSSPTSGIVAPSRTPKRQTDESYLRPLGWGSLSFCDYLRIWFLIPKFCLEISDEVIPLWNTLSILSILVDVTLSACCRDHP